MDDKINITLKSDDKGLFSRECPNENCLFNFKINLEDWKNNVSDEKVFCPHCGQTATSEKWWTSSQLKQIQKIKTEYAKNLINSQLNDSFGKLEKNKSKFVSIKVSKAPIKKIDTSIKESSTTFQYDLQCSSCKTRFSVNDVNDSICPCCGRKVEKA